MKKKKFVQLNLTRIRNKTQVICLASAFILGLYIKTQSFITLNITINNEQIVKQSFTPKIYQGEPPQLPAERYILHFS